ncbi:MAG TPA: hypothetical protein VFH59_07840 [Frateuria sp.]|uniref:hypothetical protein n=1 Tax=Frateuria sp. TaxID=2211372 RepID=UPI002D7F2B73|nr:hypothetical protein [Frateuria sp.]HET6805333.1 hypothetical protein [Frateuria sp.]
MVTPIDTIPNRPAGKRVFDFQIEQGYCRVVLTQNSNDGMNLVMSGWAYLIDAAGVPVLDDATAAPIATVDTTRTIHLSDVLAGTATLLDGWAKYVPPAGTVINADNLPSGWASGAGKPTTDGTAYGQGYYDTTGQVGYVWRQGAISITAQTYAETLEAQLNHETLLANVGL